MKNSTLKLTVSALLISLGIIIPIFSPVKIIIEPASYTLASHVVIFIAMFISPAVAATVAVGTTLGFFIGGFPIVIVFRAATHVIWATLGALYLQKMKSTADSAVALRVYSFFVALTHSLCEIVIVTAFYFGGMMGASYYQHGFVVTILGLVGLGTVIHSMVDFEIANLIRYPLRNQLKMLSSGKSGEIKSQ